MVEQLVELSASLLKAEGDKGAIVAVARHQHNTAANDAAGVLGCREWGGTEDKGVEMGPPPLRGTWWGAHAGGWPDTAG